MYFVFRFQARKLFTYLFLISSFFAYAQLDLKWSKHIGSSSNAIGHLITEPAIDENGNLYTVGKMYGGTDYESIVSSATSNFVFTAHNVSSFVAKYSPSGNLIWHREFHSTGNSTIDAISYSNGKLFMWGTIPDTLTTHDTTIVDYHVTIKDSDILLAMDTNNTIEWYKTYPPGYWTAYGILNSSETRVYLVRQKNLGNNDSLTLHCYLHDGSKVYNYGTLTSGRIQSLHEIDIDNRGNLHIVGDMYSDHSSGIDFDLQPNSSHNSPYGGNNSCDAFYFSLDSNGTFRHLIPYMTSAAVAAANVEIDQYGNIYSHVIGATGLNLDPLNTTSLNFNSNGATNSVLVKYDSTGIAINTLYIKGDIFNPGKGIIWDMSLIDSSIFILGQIYQNPDFDPGTPVVNKPSWNPDYFIAEYDLNFNFKNVDFLSLSPASTGHGYSIAFSDNYKYYAGLGGRLNFNSSQSIHPSVGGHTIKSVIIGFDNCSYIPKPLNDTLSACVNDTIQLQLNPLSGYSFKWFGVDSTSSGSMSTPAIDTDSAYTKTLFYAHVDNKGCISGKSQYHIQINPLPAPGITASGSTTYCQGDSVVLTTSSASSYQWKLNGTDITGATSASLTVAGPGNYSVEATNANGCSAISSNSSVTVNPLPNPVITALGSTTFCQGDSVVLTASSSSSYQWKLNGTDITGATSASLTATGPGNYSVEVTNTAGCSAISSISAVTVNSLPSSAVTVSGSTAFCQGDSVTLTGPSGTGLSYQWKDSGVNISGATGASYTATQTGAYSLEVTNASGCQSESSSAAVTVSSYPTAAVTAASATTFCHGDSVVLSANTSTGLTYQWKNSGTNITGATSSTYTTTGSGIYTVEVTNTAGCATLSNSTVVVVSSYPVVNTSTSGPITFCQGDSVVITANTGNGISYQWIKDGINISNATDSVYTVYSSGSYEVQVSNSIGCATTSSAINVLVVPVVNTGTIIGQNTSCDIGVSYNYLVSNNPGNTYSWAVTNGAIVSGQGTNSVQVIWGNDTTGALHVIESNGSCSDSATLTIRTTLFLDELDVNSLIVFPNPTIDNIQIQSDSPIRSLTLYNAMGVKVFEFNSIHDTDLEFSMADLPSGKYFAWLNFEYGNQTVLIMKTN